ncbi:MAG TPA: hypothetical protein VMA35_13135 [Candidatus Sulfopaludibacter sp.]|nr:hypothetical protein [Candidatus Sulfopaludibacter sp.]
MKKVILIVISLISAVRLASASSNFLYTATAAPGNTPDGTDQNANPVNVWTNVLYAGGTNGLGDGGADGSGVYFGAPFSGGLGNVWQMYSYQNDGVGLGGSVDSYNTFLGGALTAGQTVSIDFEMRATDPASTNGPAGEVGVSLMNGTNTAIKFYVYGGGPGWYFYTDAGTNAAKAGAMTYQYQAPFNIAFTVTGPNTYLAVAGSDIWTGTFSGSLTGIDVFNHRGGNASDVGYNHLKVAPQLTINSISPDDTQTLFNATNTMSFGINSPSAAVNASGIQLILNGVDVSTHLVISGGGTGNVTARYTNLLSDTIYIGQINVTNISGASVSAPVRFDTFSSNYFTWEAEDFDFSSGQFIDNPVISTNSSPFTYYNKVGVSNVDEFVLNFSTNQPHGWRPNDQVATDVANDTPRAQFTAAGVPDYLVGYFNPSNWVNYTRTFPAGTYNIYGRLANGNGGLASCTLAEVTGGQGTTSQTTTQLGVFQFSARGWNSFDFIPLSDAWGNPLVVTLSGQTTLRVTSGPLGGGVNLNFFMLAPGTNTPPAIANIHPDGSQPFQNTNVLTFTVSSAVSTVSTNNIQVTLNGINVSTQLAFTGTATNWAVSLPLPQQGSYSLAITATDAAGHSHSYSETFDTFSQNNFMIEAGDFDFNGGQWIDNPLETATTTAVTNSYFGYPGNNLANAAVYGVDFTTTNVTASESYLYRFDGNGPGGNPAAGTEVTSDFLRSKLINLGATAQAPFEYVPGEAVPTTNTDFDVGWWPPGTWLNYTRTFPNNSYNIYGRLASDTPYSGATLGLVTAGRGTSGQTTLTLGTFSDAGASGFQSWHWVPLMSNGVPAVVTLNGAQTLKVTAPPGSATGSMNAHFLMFVPFSAVAPFPISATVSGGVVTIKIPTVSGHSYSVYYSTSLNPSNWQPLATGISGDGTVKTVTDSTSGGAVRFYRAVAQ